MATITSSGNILLKEYLINTVGLWVAMLTGETAGSEVSYTGYARVKFQTGVITADPTANTNIIAWPRPPSGFTPQTITHFGLFNAASGGTLILAPSVKYNGKDAAIILSNNSGPKPGAGQIIIDFKSSA